MLGVGGILAEAVADVVFRPVPIDRGRRRRDDRRRWRPSAARRVPRRGGGRPRARWPTCWSGCRRLADDRARRRQRRRQPADRRADGAPGRRRRARRARRAATPLDAAAPRPRPTPSSSAPCSSRAASSSPARRPIRASSASSSLHNLLAGGYAGPGLRHQPRRARRCSASRPSPTSTSCPTARPTSSSCAPRRRPTPTCCAPARRRASGPRSSRRPATARRARRAAAAEAELVALADELGILLAGPNGQGVVTHAGRRCAPRSSRRTRRPGRIGVASQSGNFVSQLPELRPARPASASAGRCRPATPPRSRVADYLDCYADDPATAVGLAYVEGIADGRALLDRARARSPPRKPLVLVKGGATEGGARAAASHTGALAADDKVFDGACRAGRRHPGGHGRGGVRGGGDLRHPAAAGRPERRRADDGRRLGRRHRRRHHPRPRPRACSPLPDDLRDGDRRQAAAAVEPQQPGRLRRRRDPRHDPRGDGADRRRTPTSHAVVYLGLGIQSNQARLMRDGPLLPRTTGSSASSPTTSARTPASPRRPTSSATPPASRSSPRPSWPSPIRTTRARPPCGRPGGSATPAATGPSPRSATSTATPRRRRRRGR